MQDNWKLKNFISASSYTDPVDIKRLRFIFSAIANYAHSVNKHNNDLNILEIGCGKGGITLSLASLGCRVTAFDINVDSIQYLESEVQGRKIGNVTITVDNGYTFDDGKQYDIVVASEVFEHVSEPRKLAANVTKRMIDGSHLIVTTPNGYGPWELKNRLNPRTYLAKCNFLRRLLGKCPYVKDRGIYHCQFFTRGSLLELFSRLSLRPVRFAKSDSFLAMFRRLRSSAIFGNFDIKLADMLPYWLASGWYCVFELQKSNTIDTE